MDRRPSRRDVLGALGLAAAGSTAGCTADVGSLFGGNDSIDDDGLPPSTDADTQFRGGLERRGVYPDAEIPTDAAVEWTVPEINTGDHTAAKASPAVAPGGDVVVPGDNGEVRRVTPAGEVEWTASVDETSRGIHGTPAIANETVYIGAYDGALYAFDLDTGERFWREKLGDAIGSSPAYFDGTVYIAVEYYDPSGAMFAVDAVDGTVEWDDQRVTNHPHSTCAIDRDAERLVVGANDGQLYAWTFPSLGYAWEFSTERPIKGPIATADGSAFFGSWDDTIYRVDLEEGTEEWSFEPDSDVMQGPSLEVETETVYVGSHDSRLYALDMASGEERWRYDTDGYLIGCPTVTSEHVLVGSYDGHLYAVEKGSGEGVWAIEGNGRVTSTPIVADGAVYFTDRASESYLEDGEGGTGQLYKVGPAENAD